MCNAVYNAFDEEQGDLDVIKLIDFIDTLPNKNDDEKTKCLTETQDAGREEQVIISKNNIIHEAVAFHRVTSLTSTDLVETIRLMLKNKKYALCESFATSKLNFDEANTEFLSAVAPQKLNKEDLYKLLFV
jgi:hypothetical protein